MSIINTLRQDLQDYFDTTGVTKTAFANKIGVHVNTIFNFLRGDVPSGTVIQAIEAEIYD